MLPVPEKYLFCNEPLNELTCIISPSPVNFLIGIQMPQDQLCRRQCDMYL
jgi:hypothetical protein